MATKTQEQILESLEMTWVCPGAKECGVTKCQHAVPHSRTDGCENGCLGTTGCISLAEKRKGGVV